MLLHPNFILLEINVGAVAAPPTRIFILTNNSLG